MHDLNTIVQRNLEQSATKLELSKYVLSVLALYKSGDLDVFHNYDVCYCVSTPKYPDESAIDWLTRVAALDELDKGFEMYPEFV